MPSPPLMRDHHQRAPARSCSPPSLTSKGSMEKKLLVTHLPWVSNWRWYSWNSLLCKVTAESQAFHSPFKRLTPKEKSTPPKGFMLLIPFSLCLESKKTGAQAGSEAALDPGSSLFPFPYETIRKRILPLHYLCARGPRGMFVSGALSIYFLVLREDPWEAVLSDSFHWTVS